MSFTAVIGMIGCGERGVDRMIDRSSTTARILMVTGVGGAGGCPKKGVDGVGRAGVRLLPGADAAVLR